MKNNVVTILENTLQEVNAAKEEAVANQDFVQAALLRDLGDYIKKTAHRLKEHKPSRTPLGIELYRMLEGDAPEFYRRLQLTPEEAQLSVRDGNKLCVGIKTPDKAVPTTLRWEREHEVLVIPLCMVPYEDYKPQ